MKSLVVGAEGGVLESVLQRLAPETIRKSSANGDIVDLSAWELGRDDLPAVCRPGDFATLGAIMLSPLALSVRDRKGRWHDDLSKAGPERRHGAGELGGSQVPPAAATGRAALRPRSDRAPGVHRASNGARFASTRPGSSPRQRPRPKRWQPLHVDVDGDRCQSGATRRAPSLDARPFVRIISTDPLSVR